MNRRMMLTTAIATTMMGAGTTAYAQDSTLQKVRDSGVLRVVSRRLRLGIPKTLSAANGPVVWVFPWARRWPHPWESRSSPLR